jgi:hypothetical protein
MTAKPLWTKVDTRDDRREVHGLLVRLPPRLRISWLKWCCTKCALPNSDKRAVVLPTTTGQNAMEIYFDFWSLCNEYRLDPMVGLNALIDVVHHWEKG